MQQHVWMLAILTSNLWLSPLPGSCSRILVVPVDVSHWLNMEIILKELHSQGHNLTVMRSNTSWYIPEKSPFYSIISMRTLQDDVDLDIYNKMLRENLEYHKMGSVISTIYQQWYLAKIFAAGHSTLAKEKVAFIVNLQSHYLLI